MYEKDSQGKMYPASLTKIMTCILALEMVDDLDNETTSLKTYIQEYLYNLRVNGGVDVQTGGIYLNETLCIRDLLYAMMLQSANEAAMMVADYIGDGSIEYFCELMNAKAKEIGAKNTNFSNPSGLYDSNNYSTAYDMAKIAEYAMQNPEFVEIVTTQVYTSQPTNKQENGIQWVSTNRMQNPGNTEYYYDGLQGIKTGTLEESGSNFISTATRDGYTYLLVVMGAPLEDDTGATYAKNLAFVDTKYLYDWAFENFRVKTLMDVGDPIAEVPVRLNWDKDHVQLLASEKYQALVHNEVTSDSVQTIPELPDHVDAPIEKGEEIGYVKLMLEGQEIGRVALVAGENIEQSKALYYMDKVKSFFNTFLFKFVFVFVLVIIVLYIALMVVRNHNKRRYQSRRRKPPTKL